MEEEINKQFLSRLKWVGEWKLSTQCMFKVLILEINDCNKFSARLFLPNKKDMLENFIMVHSQICWVFCKLLRIKFHV